MNTLPPSPFFVPEDHRAWVRHAADLGRDEDDAANDLIPGILAPGEQHQVLGEAKKAKTWVALWVLVALAAGKPVFGWRAPAQPIPILLIEEEHRLAELNNRLRRIANGLGVVLGDVHLFVAHRAGFRLDQPEWIRKLRDLITRCAICIVAVDPLARVHRVDENSAQEMRAVLDGLQWIQQVAQRRRLGQRGDDGSANALRVATLVLHHVGKSDRNGAYAGRGSTSVPAEADLIWSVDAKTNKATGRLAEVSIQFVGKRPVEPVRIVVEEDDDFFRFVVAPIDEEEQKNGKSNGKGGKNVLADVLAYLAVAGSTARNDLPKAVEHRREAVLKVVADGLASHLLIEVGGAGTKRIALARASSAAPNSQAKRNRPVQTTKGNSHEHDQK